jgi:hypothetical protein
MPSVDEALAGAKSSQLAAAQGAGIDALSQGAVVLFRLYLRQVLPADGFVFWVRADQLSPVAALNTHAYNPTRQVTPASLHHSTVNQQDADESFSLQRMTLTCQQPVDFLTDIAPNELWVGEHAGLRFAFSQRTGYYRQANVFHYRGDALYPALETQLVDSLQQLRPATVVSNSLPIWLGLNTLPPPPVPLTARPPFTSQLPFTLYPSYLVPDNLPPPYAAVNIGDDDTSPLTAGAYYDNTLGRYQHARDRVRITTFGVRGEDVATLLDTVTQFTLMHPTALGVMNTPTVRDAKRGQVEFSAIAQKKVIEFVVSYTQTALRDLTRQLITSWTVNYGFPPRVAA